MFTKAFTDAKNWGWLIDDPRDTGKYDEMKDDSEKEAAYANDMSINQMLGANGITMKKRVYKSSLFDGKHGVLSERENKQMYRDNPLFIGEFEIKVPDKGLYLSGYHKSAVWKAKPGAPVGAPPMAAPKKAASGKDVAIKSGGISGASSVTE